MRPRDMTEFYRKYQGDAHWLETKGSYQRIASGEGEGGESESLWFCRNCDATVDHPTEGCEECGQEPEL